MRPTKMDDWELTDDLTGPLLDTLAGVVVILDREGRIRRVNRACADLIGYDLTEIRDEKVWDLMVPAEELAAVKAVFADLLAGNSPNHHTNHWIARNGQKRLIAWSNSAVYGPGGDLTAVIGTGIDITEQKAAEAALSERQASLNAILQTATDAIVTIDLDGQIKTLNPAAETLFGYDSSELVGHNVSLLMPEPYRSEHHGYIARYLASGEQRIIGIGREVTGQRKDGSKFPMHLAVSEFQYEGERRFTGIIHDISERKERERLNTRLGRIVENSVNEVFVFDAQSLRFLQANQGAVENLGYSREEILALTPPDLMPDRDRDRFETLLASLRSGAGDRVEFETSYRRKDGTRYDVTVRLEFMASEQPPVFIAIVEDVTERKVQNEQLRQAQKIEVIGQLTGGIAHDFNNLLTAIIGNLEMLEARLDDPEQREIAAEALEAAELGADLTRRLLAFARRQPLEPQAVDLNNLVLKTSDLLRRTLGEAIRIKTILGRDMRRVRADPGQLENAVLNLAINARDAMPEGGDLTVGTGNAVIGEDGGESVEGLPAGHYVCLSVADRGEGMSAAVKERAFEPFFTTKRTGSGTGLGLSMVYGFAKQSGGQATIESAPGKGTVVRIYLPAIDAPVRAEVPGAVKQDKGLGGRESILLVEDDNRVRRITARWLKAMGYRVTQAGDAATALNALQENEGFDLLFTDVVIPGDMGGSDLAIEARYLRPGIKILLTSGYADPEPLDATKAIAEARFLRKPYKEAELARTVRRALDG